MTRRVALVLLDPRTPPAAPPGNRAAHWRAALAEDVAAPAGGVRPLDPALEGRDAPRALLPAGPR